MKIIDAHTHVRLHPDEEDLSDAQKIGIDCTPPGLIAELNDNQISGSIVIDDSLEEETPTGFDSMIEISKQDPRIFPVVSINPNKITEKSIEKIKEGLEKKLIYGIKIYLGYHPRYATDLAYSEFYSLAGQYGCPVILHTGDTYGSQYQVKYAHPLQLDELAVNFKRTNFIMAHLGNPWNRDASEVLYKNDNVFADLSAFCIGEIKNVPEYVFRDIKFAMEYVNNPDKFLYGSDWPLVKMKDYIEIMKKAVPEEFHEKFFFENAKRLFRLPL